MTRRTVFDIEGNGLYLDCTKLWCIVSKTGSEELVVNRTCSEELYEVMTPTVRAALAELDRATILVGHGIIDYDLRILEKFFNWRPKDDVEIVDTLVKSRLLNPDRKKPTNYTGKGGPHSLEAWGYRVGRGKISNEEWGVYTPNILLRCNEDVEINALTDDCLSTEEIGHNWDEALQLEYKFAKIVADQASHGILVDQEKMTALVTLFDKKVADIDSELIPKLPTEVINKGLVSKPYTNKGTLAVRIVNYFEEELLVWKPKTVAGPFTKVKINYFNLNSIKKVKEYLLDNGWKPTEYNYSKKTGERTSPKLTEDSFHSVVGEMPRLVKERVMLNQRRSTVQGWFERLRGDGRLTAGVNSCGTNTGRVRHIGVANIPRVTTAFGKEMRAVFIPSPGHVMVGHDASGLELRMLAHYMNDSLFIQEILDGDIHAYNQQLAGLPTRDAAKTFMYAFLYGAGDEKIGAIIGEDAYGGREIKQRFLQSLPNLAKLIQRVKRASKKGWLRGLDNRKIWMRRNDQGEVLQHTALNTLLQSAGAVVMKKSAVILDQSVRETGISGTKVIDYHDEAQWEIIPEDAERYQELAEKSVVEAGVSFNLNIPLAAESKVGNSWAETH